MLLLAWGKLLTGRQLDNLVLHTEARVTLVDAYLAATVLVGVVLNGWLGWWWADPLSGLVLAVPDAETEKLREPLDFIRPRPEIRA